MKLSPERLKLALAFARLELLEVEHGRREITHCPGVLEVAAHIEALTQESADEVSGALMATDARLRNG